MRTTPYKTLVMGRKPNSDELRRIYGLRLFCCYPCMTGRTKSCPSWRPGEVQR